MASDLLSIASSGARVARAALDVTAQNIANASTEGYVRRSLQTAEVASTGGPNRATDLNLAGVWVDGLKRNVDSFRQAEVRRTSGDLERANVELSGLRDIESAVEQSGLFGAIVDFEAGLQQLSGDVVDPARRTEVITAADTLASSFNIADANLNTIGQRLRLEADAQTSEANTIATELARLNEKLVRTGSNDINRATLLDQRDLLLERLSGISSITTQFQENGTVNVTLGTNPARSFVQGTTAGTLSLSVATDGTLSFAVDGAATDPGSGGLAGASLALTELANTRGQLDSLASGLADAVNNAQAAGVALDGSQGQPIFAGSTIATLSVVASSGDAIATAPTGAGPGSRDGSNLAALRQALSSLDPARGANNLLLDVSSKVAGRSITQSALETIASSARTAMEEQTGVDLDQEAANLIRYQQAFQASGRAMQVASDIFDTLLGIR
jgi:flagellar hook-associated protein 1 FlgK